MKIKEVIVVEGKADTIKIQQAVQADTIETNGLAISDEVIEQIKHAKEKRGIIIFTDPDFPGEKIRQTIHRKVPGCKHAFLAKDKARAPHSSHKSLGIEHASIEDLREALEGVYEMIASSDTDISRKDLIKHGLIGVPESRRRRELLGQILNIGYTNGKQLLKRLKMFNIRKQQFVLAMEKVNEEEGDGN